MRSSTATSDAWQHSVAPMEEALFFRRATEGQSAGVAAEGKDNWRGRLDAMENGCKLEKAVA